MENNIKGLEICDATESHYKFRPNCMYRTIVNPVRVNVTDNGEVYINNKLAHYYKETNYWASDEEIEYLKKSDEAKDIQKSLEQKLAIFKKQKEDLEDCLMLSITKCELGGSIGPIKEIEDRLKVFEYLDRLDELVSKVESRINTFKNKANHYKALATAARGK